MRRFGFRGLFLLLGVLTALAAGSVAAGATGGNETGVRFRPPATGPCDSDIAFGEIVACTINSAGQMKDLTFAGAVNDRIRVRVVETSGSLVPKTQIRRPNGTIACSDTTAQNLTCLLNTNGTHTVRVADAAGTNTGTFNMTIQRLNNPVGCVKGRLGKGKTGSITAAAEIDCFSLANIGVGDVLRTRTAETGGTLFAISEVIRPDGSTLCGPNSNVEATCTADQAGTYRVLLSDNGTATGTYAIWFQRLNNPAGCTTIAFGGSPHAGSIDVAAETDCYRFSASNGDHVRVRVSKTSGTLNPLVEVVRPNGTTLCGPTTSVDFNCTLDANGKHTILVRDAGGTATGGYTARVDLL
jgi:hypothetical protein